MEILNESIPKDKNYPSDSVQCNYCGGFGCAICGHKGWLEPADHPHGRRCCNSRCNQPLAPNHFAVYCSDQCAADDA